MEWLKSELERQGITQKTLGEAVGLSEVQMSKLMAGDRRLLASEAASIWRYLGYTLPDDEASEVDKRILQLLSRMTDEEKIALERLLCRS